MIRISASRLFRRLAVPALLAAAAGPLPAGPPRVFTDPAEGVAHGREGSRLILFLLLESFAPESEGILKGVTDELSTRGDEFAIVRCRPENAEHRRLFQDRFRQDPATLPVAVVASPDGTVVAGAHGREPGAYRLLIRAARVQAGLEKDAKAVAAIRAELAGDGDTAEGGIFGIRREEVMTERVPLIDLREWTFQDGARLKAALIEAKGATGIFRKGDGTEIERPFNDLSPADKAFLTERLSPP